jgi:hypothetical protein
MGWFKRFVCSLSLYLTVTACCAFGTSAIAQPTKSPISSEVTEINGYPFPQKLASLSRFEKTDYHSAKWGFSVRYGDPQAWADIYIYNGARNLASGNARKEAASELEAALAEIAYSVSSGGYEDAKLIEKSETNGFAKAHLTITQRQQARDSYVFITVHKMNLVKIRVTTSKKNPDQFADKLLTEYAKLLGF